MLGIYFNYIKVIDKYSLAIDSNFEKNLFIITKSSDVNADSIKDIEM